ELDLLLAADRHDDFAHLASQPVDIGVRRDIAKAYGVLALEGMTGCGDDDVALLVQRIRAQAWGVALRRMQDREIELSGFEAARKVGERAFVHGELDAGMQTLEARQQTGEPQRADGRHDAELERRLMQQPELGRDLPRRVGLIEHLCEMRLDALAEVGE